MGTNFYIKRPDDGLDLHIGKSSAGWCFALHVYPEAGLNNLDDWEELLYEPYITIEDEYGRRITPTDMLNCITNRSWAPALDLYDQAFHDQNGSEPGPNGLVRSKIDGVHCIGHGEGTYDYVVGDFS